MSPQAEKTNFGVEEVDENVRNAGLLSRKRTATAGTVSQPVKRFSKAEVAKHDRPEDCWMIIRGKVYDVTSW